MDTGIRSVRCFASKSFRNSFYNKGLVKKKTQFYAEAAVKNEKVTQERGSSTWHHLIGRITVNVRGRL